MSASPREVARRLVFALAIGWLLVLQSSSTLAAPAAVRVVATTPALADLTRQVGGDAVRVESLMRGPENSHNVVPKPSFVMKLRKADLFVHLGLDAEPWVPNLLRAARRKRLLAGGEGNVDTSRGIELLEIPGAGELTRAMGDIHVFGNTHYMLDPLNGIAIGRTIASALARIDPGRAALFEAGAEELDRSIRSLVETLIDRMKPLQGLQVVPYHRTWPYFLRRFSLERLAEVEPKPGIAPGPRHISRVAEQMKEHGVGLVIVETFSDRRTAERLAELAGGQAVTLAQEVDALPGVDTYQSLFEYNVDVLLEAHRELRTSKRSGEPTR